MKMKMIFVGLLSLCCSTLMAQQEKVQKAKTDTAKNTVKPISSIVTKDTESKNGMINIHRNGDKYYFEIPDALLKRELLVTSWLVTVPGGSPKFGGEIMNTRTISFEKGFGGKMIMRAMSVGNQVDPKDNIAKAVANSSIDAIAMVFDIKAGGQKGKSSVIDVTDFLQKENTFTMLSPEVKSKMSVTAMAADRSYLKSVASYPTNMEFKMVRTYAASAAGGKAAPGRPAVAPIEAAKIGSAITMEVSVSIFLMPEKPMMPRHFDLRVGYFANSYMPLSDEQQTFSPTTFIVRYRLEPKAEDMAKYKRGELVEPKEQIVYYIDPATPKQWRPYLIAGINDWNVAFEAAGFKNAIVGKEWPENDTTMSLEDARYKVLRYLPSDIPNAYGPNIHDPRSGEILQSYVGWYHNVMSLVHDWYMVQASPNDPRARKMKFSDELMGELIRFVSSHEVGHTLGLRHNMGSSSCTPVEKLRDKHWLEEHGHSSSIMDYARFNYVAQPQDSVNVAAGIMPRINDYDKWAIKWGYTYIGAKNDQEDKRIVSKWITDSLKVNPRLWFGGEGMNFDARCQTEDVGDNAMKASAYGIENLKYVLTHLADWTKEDNDLYNNQTKMYLQVATQFNRYVNHVVKNIASVYETFKMPEEPGDVYSSAPVEKQKEAVAFLNKQVFETPMWLLDLNMLNKIGSPTRSGAVRTVQNSTMIQLFSDRVFNTLNIMEQRFGKEKTYSVTEYLADLKSGVWKELQSSQAIDMYRRDVQKNYINCLLRVKNEAEVGNNALGLLFGGPTAAETMPFTTNTDIGSVLGLHLENLRKEILAAADKYSDKDSKEHLLFVANQIKKSLK
jgi:hypothetical protein